MAYTEYVPSVSAMFSVCPSSPMVCTARHSSPAKTYTVTGYATVASLPEPPERVRTCSTELPTWPVGETAVSSSSPFSHAVSPSTARADTINDKCFIVL